MFSCTVSIYRLIKKIRFMDDTYWGMQIYICEITGDVMSEEKLEYYREYWKKEKLQ